MSLKHLPAGLACILLLVYFACLLRGRTPEKSVDIDRQVVCEFGVNVKSVGREGRLILRRSQLPSEAVRVLLSALVSPEDESKTSSLAQELIPHIEKKCLISETSVRARGRPVAFLIAPGYMEVVHEADVATGEARTALLQRMGQRLNYNSSDTLSNIHKVLYETSFMLRVRFGCVRDPKDMVSPGDKQGMKFHCNADSVAASRRIPFAGQGLLALTVATCLLLAISAANFSWISAIPKQTSTTTSPARRRHLGFDGLKALAFTGVFYSHFFEKLTPPGWRSTVLQLPILGEVMFPWYTWLANGHMVVPLFFTITGYFVGQVDAEVVKGGVVSWVSWRPTFRWLVRNWPVYAVVAIIVFLETHGSELHTDTSAYLALLQSLTLTSQASRHNFIHGFVPGGWWVSVASSFMLVAPFCKNCLKHYGRWRMVILVCCCCLVTRMVASFREGYTYMPMTAFVQVPKLTYLRDSILGRLDDFVVGLAASRHPPLPKEKVCATAILGICFFTLACAAGDYVQVGLASASLMPVINILHLVANFHLVVAVRHVDSLGCQPRLISLLLCNPITTFIGRRSLVLVLLHPVCWGIPMRRFGLDQHTSWPDYWHRFFVTGSLFLVMALIVHEANEALFLRICRPNQSSKTLHSD